MARYFFAHPLSRDDQQTLNSLTQALKKQTHAEWVPAENYHVTLAYLGPVSDETLPDLIDFADNELDFGLLPVRWTLNHFSRFRSGVLYATGYNTPPAMTRFAKALEVLIPHEYQHKNFIPHVTLARQAGHIDAHEFEQALLLDRITLFESRPAKNAPAYVPVREWLAS